MLEIARQIGMPAEFVALRHEATHEELPSLQRLVGVTGEALEWLWRVYWSRLDEGGEVEVEEAGVGLNLNFVGLEVRSLLRDYRSQRRGFLKGKGTKMSEQASAEFARRYVSAFAAQCGNQPMALSTVTNALVDDKMIYPADREYVSRLVKTCLSTTNDCPDSMRQWTAPTSSGTAYYSSYHHSNLPSFHASWRPYSEPCRNIRPVSKQTRTPARKRCTSGFCTSRALPPGHRCERRLRSMFPPGS